MWLISIRKPKIQHLKNCNCIFAPIKVVFGWCKSISGKYFIFRKCYFPERKIFSCVWLHFKIFFENIFWCLEKKKEEAKPRKTWTNLEEHGAISWSMERSCDRRRDLTKRQLRSARTVLREIVISDCDRRRDLVKHRSRSSRTVLRKIAPLDRNRRCDFAFFLSLVLPLRELSLHVPSSGNHLKLK